MRLIVRERYFRAKFHNLLKRTLLKKTSYAYGIFVSFDGKIVVKDLFIGLHVLIEKIIKVQTVLNLCSMLCILMIECNKLGFCNKLKHFR